jgi:hypothetical protein
MTTTLNINNVNALSPTFVVSENYYHSRLECNIGERDLQHLNERFFIFLHFLE